MTTTNASLALARAVYPDMVWEDNGHHVVAQCNGFCVIFNPRDYRANNPNAPDQFVDVLAWLLKSDPLAQHWELTMDQSDTRQSLIDAVVTAAEKAAAATP